MDKSLTPQGRQPFSPLQAQSLNSPRRLGVPDPVSPTKSPLSPKVSQLQLKPKAKKEAEPKKTKGKGKAKAKADDENVEADQPPPKKRGRPKKVALEDSESSKEAASTPVRKTVRSAAPKAPSPEPEPAEPELEPEAEPEVEAAEEAPAVEEAIVIDEVVEEVVVVKEAAVVEPADHRIDVDEAPETDAPETDAPEAAAPAADEADQDEADAMEVDASDVVAPDADTDVGESDDDIVEAAAPPSPSPVKKAAAPLKMISPIKQTSPIKMDSPTKAPANEPTKSSSPVKTAEQAEPAAPARQVRSSWLNQALGNRPVPVNARTSTVGNATVRQSLMSSSQLKRKSEDGPGHDAADKQEAKRAEKVARFDSQATDAATGQPASPVRSTIFASRQPGSATSLPASAAVGTPSATATRNPTSVPATKSDKVTRALEELRERTAAAAAAKQKSGPANKLANAAKAPVPVASSSSGGFLRGLGGLFGLGASTEDQEALRRREDEDRRAQEKAEADLARIMSEMAEEDRKTAAASTKSPEPTRKATVNKKPTKVFPTSEPESDQMGDVAIVVDDEDEDADDESDDNEVTMPELPTPDIGDDYDDEPFEDGPTSALGAAGIDFTFESTTPPNTPPLNIKRVGKIQTPQIVISPPPKETTKPPLKKSNLGSAVRTNIPRPPTASSTDYDYDDDDEDMDEDDTMSIRSGKKPGPKSRVVASSKSRSSVLSQAERMAAKSLGVKPATGPVASVQRAAEAAKREEAANARKAELRAQIERRKQEEARRKEEAERIAAEEERKRKAAEQEERRKRLAEAEKRRQEREERTAQMAKERAAREEREAAEARAKAAEEEAARKRKVAAMLSKSQVTAAAAATAASSSKRIAQAASTPGPKTLRASSSKSGLKTPSNFRDEHTTSTSTIKLVSKSGIQRSSNATTYTSAQALQASRQNLQAQLDAKVEVSEDIVLPDIASEYSDSDDSEKETDFKRPAWAESPELKSALERQATLNPDELFGAIRPLNMDELFKQRAGKFRARTSSANWTGADRLTEAEEREYARRMGFKPLNAPREGGGSAGDR